VVFGRSGLEPRRVEIASIHLERSARSDACEARKLSGHIYNYFYNLYIYSYFYIYI